MYSPEIIRYLQRRGCNRLNIKAALIDMDGTLYDSMPCHVEGWRHLTRLMGWTMGENELYLYEGMKGVATVALFEKKHANRNLSEQEIADIYKIKADYFNAHAKYTVMPGAPEMLKALQDFGIRRILVTGSSQKKLLGAIDSDFPGVFAPNDRITAYDIKKGKPDPESYLQGLARAGVRAEEAIVIENAPLGVESGHRSGAFTVAVTTGPIPVQAFEEAGADIIFPSMTDFANALPLLLLAAKSTRV
ncbi:MAG: HAD-IA family hydrolase [Muribaculaceae bacterium]|nr:HAD-IA family hydrolase [Muribaculaceae bacterium]